MGPFFQVHRPSALEMTFFRCHPDRLGDLANGRDPRRDLAKPFASMPLSTSIAGAPRVSARDVSGGFKARSTPGAPSDQARVQSGFSIFSMTSSIS